MNIKTWKENLKPEFHSVAPLAMQFMQAEIDELRAELAALKSDVLRLTRQAFSACVERDEALMAGAQERDELEAKRYRWLREESTGDPFWKEFDKGMTANEMDAAIDAAMKGDKQ